jgi:16S rRNA C1402 (ribose-2'-O) methylase RsmI
VGNFETKKDEFKNKNPFLSELELNEKTTAEINRRKSIVARETKRTQNYCIEFKKDRIYEFKNANNKTKVNGEWTIIVNKYNDTTLWLLDNKTNKTFEHILQKEENGYIMRMPVPIKGKQNTRMRKKLNKNQPPTGVLQKWGICTKFKHSTSN